MNLELRTFYSQKFPSLLGKTREVKSSPTFNHTKYRLSTSSRFSPRNSGAATF